jgi:hypothetical protein
VSVRLSGLRAMPRETLGLAAARAPDVDPIGRFADHVHETLHEAMDPTRSYSADPIP